MTSSVPAPSTPNGATNCEHENCVYATNYPADEHTFLDRISLHRHLPYRDRKGRDWPASVCMVVSYRWEDPERLRESARLQLEAADWLDAQADGDQLSLLETAP